MIRLLTILAALLAILVLAERSVTERERAHEQLYGTLRPLVPIEKGDVTQIVAVAGNGRTWRYVYVDSSWRYPAYFNAYIQPQRIDHLLNSVLQSSASIVSTESGDLQRYGLFANSPTLTLLNTAGVPLMSLRLGRGAPDMRASESYVQIVGADTIYHLHANAAHAFDSGDPPMLDMRLRPRALPSKSIAHISFSGSPVLSALHREQIESSDTPAMPGAPPTGPTYVWKGAFAEGGLRECVANSAYAYVGFLERLSWSELRNPANHLADFTSARALYLADEEGAVDTLEVGLPSEAGTLLHYRTTGQVAVIPNEKAALLFPAASALLDSLPKPTPYERVEPFTPF